MSDLPCGLEPTDPPSWLDWYLYAAGVSLVPPEYHLWCGLATLAAAVADRVWFEKFKGERLTANLYVMLIGPSGVGKNQAIRRGQKRLEAIPNADRAGLYRGKISAQSLLGYLSGHTGNGKRRATAANCIWLLTPELAMQVGNGPKAEDFITHMTELLDSDQTLQDTTRTSGHFAAQRPCINWTSGTTAEWLLRSVGRHDILGGFFARIFPVPAERVPWRLPTPLYPVEYDDVNEWLEWYLDELTYIEGEMTLDPDAAALHAWWIDEREEPADEALWPFYSHGDNLLLKLAMCCALADEHKLVIEYAHMANALALYEWVYTRLGGVLEWAYRTPDVERLNVVADFLRRTPTWVAHSLVLKYVSNRGIIRDVFEVLLKTLVERGDVQCGRVGTGRGYLWIGERHA